MNLALKNVLTIGLKNAVNALLTNTGLWITMPNNFNLHNWSGIKHILYAALSVIGSREATVWLPILLKWSVTSANPAAERTAEGGLVVPPPKP